MGSRARWGTEIVGKVKAWAGALTGPTSLPGKYPELMNPPGSETGPGQRVTWGKSTVVMARRISRFDGALRHVRAWPEASLSAAQQFGRDRVIRGHCAGTVK
jgi:hypothetical protein